MTDDGDNEVSGGAPIRDLGEYPGRMERGGEISGRDAAYSECHRTVVLAVASMFGARRAAKDLLGSGFNRPPIVVPKRDLAAERGGEEHAGALLRVGSAACSWAFSFRGTVPGELLAVPQPKGKGKGATVEERGPMHLRGCAATIVSAVVDPDEGWAEGHVWSPSITSGH